MTGTFVIINHWGAPEVADALPALSARRLDLMRKCWERCLAFSSEGSYRMSVRNPPVFGPFRTLLTKICYNPIEKFDGAWEKVGEFDRKALIQAVKRGLKSDDDIIKQWFTGKDVVKLLEGAQNFDETLLAVKAIRGKHEVDPSVMSFVERILGKRPDSEE